MKPQGSLGPSAALLLFSPRPRSSVECFCAFFYNVRRRLLSWECLCYIKNNREKDAHGSKNRVQFDRRPKKRFEFSPRWRAGGRSESVHSLTVPSGGQKRERGPGICDHLDSTKWAWESPIVLSYYNTLLFHFVGRTTLFSRGKCPRFLTVSWRFVHVEL